MTRQQYIEALAVSNLVGVSAARFTDQLLDRPVTLKSDFNSGFDWSKAPFTRIAFHQDQLWSDIDPNSNIETGLETLRA